MTRRGPRGSPRAPRARRRRATIAAGGPAPRSCSCCERAAPGVGVAVGQRQRRVVRAPDRGPQCGRRLPVAGQLEGVGLGDRGGDLVGDPRAPAPQGQLAEDPGGVDVARPARRRPRSRRRRPGYRRAARRPRRARRPRPRCTAARRSARTAPAPSSRTSAEPGSPRRARTSASVTPARMRGIDDERRSPRTTERRLGRLGPPALLELRARLEALQVQPPQVQARLGAVLEAAGQRRVGERVVTVAQPHPGEMAVAPRDVLRQPGLERERDAALQLVAPGVVAGQELHGAHGVERVEADLDVVEVRAELQRAGAPGDGALGVLTVHAQRRDVRVGQPELASGRERLQRGDGFLAEALRFSRAVPGAEEHDRQAAHPVALTQPVAQRSMAPQRLLHRLDRLVAVVGEEGAAEAALEEHDAFLRRQIHRKAQGTRVLSRRLAMGADRVRARGGLGREPQHGARVTGGLGVVREPRGLRSADRRRGERRQGGPVQRRPAVRRQRLLDRHPRQLVAEGDAVGRRGQHPRAEALVEAGELVLAGQRVEQPQLRVGLGHGDRAEQRRGRRAQARGAGQDRVADRRRDVAIATGQHLGQEERVARRPAVELPRVDAVRLGELRDGIEREPRQLAAGDPLRRGQLAEHDPQGVAKLELVVAIGGDDQRRRRVHLAREESQDVEGRLVGPVQVLEDEHGRRAARELAQQGGRDLVRVRPTRGHACQLAAGVLGDVEQRTQGARREQRVARPPQDPRRLPVAVREAAHERRLPGAGLAGHEHHAPARRPADRVQRRLERGELTRALQEVARLLEPGRRCC